jgi:hypothetical protein
LVCLTKFIIYVQLPPFVRAVAKQIRTRVQVQRKGRTTIPKIYITGHRNISNDV